jgi:hypothetical protein
MYAYVHYRYIVAGKASVRQVNRTSLLDSGRTRLKNDNDFRPSEGYNTFESIKMGII